jgi:hypothetical protein
MSVQLISEIFVTLVLFALGVVGYTLSKYGKAWLLGTRSIQKTACSVKEDDVPSMPKSEEMVSGSQEIQAKKVMTTQAKNAEARKRARRQSKKESQLQVTTQEGKEEDSSYEKVYESTGGKSYKKVFNTGVFTSIVSTTAKDAEANANVVVTGISSTSTIAEEAEENASVITSTASTTAEEAEANAADETDVTTTCVETPKAVPEEVAAESADECPLQVGSYPEESYVAGSVIAEGDEEDDTNFLQDEEESTTMAEGEEYEDDKYLQDGERQALMEVGSEIDVDDQPCYDIPSTPPPEDELLYPQQFTDGAQPFTDGHQLFEPTMAPGGQQLYTDGQQFFMLACMEVPTTPTHQAEPATYNGFAEIGAVNYAAGFESVPFEACCASDEVDDLWDTPWEDFIPEAFEPLAVDYSDY